jgi:hypothetical protein
MKKLAYIILVFFSLTLLATACSNKKKVIATNKEKAEYLEQKKDKYDEPVKPDNAYDKESGFGGGVKKR